MCSAYQRCVAKYYDKKVKLREFKAGDCVLRKVNLMTREPRDGKLAPKWEGRYRIVSSSKNRAYRLVIGGGKSVQGRGTQSTSRSITFRFFDLVK